MTQAADIQEAIQTFNANWIVLRRMCEAGFMSPKHVARALPPSVVADPITEDFVSAVAATLQLLEKTDFVIARREANQTLYRLSSAGQRLVHGR